MINQITRMAVILTAFGFLSSCTTADHLRQTQNHLESNRLNQAVQTADRAIANEPDNPEPYLLKATALQSIAQKSPAAERPDIYREMINSLDMASRLAALRESYSIQEKAEDIRVQAFDFEYGLAAALISENQEISPGKASLNAAVYLENARIIDPERQDIYETLNFIYSGNRMYDEALQVMEGLLERKGTDNRIHELLGYLYYQTGDMDAAIEHLQNAWNQGRGKPNTGRGLANAYKKTGMSMSEREVLEQLVEMEPSNAYHHLALGVNLMNEVFASIQDLMDSRDTAYANEQIVLTLNEIERIEAMFEQAVQVERNHILANLSAGLFYRNLSFLLINLADKKPGAFSDNPVAGLVDDFFYKSLNYLEHASELDPDQTLIWNALWPVYERLEMPAQAREARHRAGE